MRKMMRRALSALAVMTVISACTLGLAAVMPQRVSAEVICHDIFYWRVSATEVQFVNVVLQPMTAEPRFTIYYQINNKVYPGVKPRQLVNATLPQVTSGELISITATVKTNDGRSGVCTGDSLTP